MKTFAHDPFVKIAHKSLAYILVFCVVNMPVWALDWSGGTNASFNGTDTVTVDALRSIGVWNNFDTAPGELIQFLQNGGGALTANHAVLNKVIGADPTLFEGLLRGGQGHIILFNPNGITIGGTAVIDAGRFTATTMGLTMTDDEFIAGNSDFEFAKGSDDPAAQISLLAGSSVTAERVDLLAQQINNAGTIKTETGGIVVMAAGDRVLLGEAGSDVIVEMTGIENGMVTNDGTIKAPEGTIVMAAGDIFSTSLGMKVFNGAGKIVQNGTLNVNAENATAVTGNGGTIEMLAGEDVTLATGSVTTANAIPDDATNRYDGGDIIIESTETVNISLGAFLYAKGNGWDDLDENFRFDFGVDTSFSGSIQIFGRNLNLPSPDDYTAPDSFSDHFDLLGYNEGPLQQLQSGFFTIGNNEGDIIVAEGPLPGTSAANTVYEEWIETVSYSDIHVDILSSGNITFNDLNPGDNKDLGLIGLDGNIALRTRYDDGGILVPSYSDEIDLIGTTGGGDIFMVAGSGGITTGSIAIINEDKTGDPGQIILATANGGDIDTDALLVKSGNREIVSISSGGDVTIDGGVLVSTNEVPDSIDKTATAEICIDAGDDIDITGPIVADSHGKVNMYTSIHIDAGLDPESNDPGEDQAGIINIDLDGKQIVAISEESGPDPEGINDLFSIATIEIHTSAQGEDAINIINGKAGGNQAIQVRAKVQGQSPVGDSLAANDPTDYYDERITQDGNIEKTQIVKVEILSGVNYDDKVEYPDCDDCVQPPFLPPTPKFFLVKNDAATIDWRAGYTIIGDGSYDPANLDVLLNDNGPGVPLFEADIIGADGDPIVLITEKGGTLEWVQFEYTDGDSVTHIYDGFVYTPPSYTEDFEWDGVSDYATFTDSFEYRAQIGDDISLNIATVTLTVQNEVPTLAGDSDTIHMNTSSDFDLSTLVTDNDGTPGELTADFTGTYGDLSYDIVEGLIPVSDGDLPTDGTLSLTGPTITYTPLDGYVSPTGEPTTFGYTVTDDNITDTVFELPDGEDLDVTVTNTAPTFAGDLGDVHMNTIVTGIDLLDPAYAYDADGDPLQVIVNGQIATVSDFIEGNNVTAAELEYQGNDSWTYTPADGYTGGESFTVTLWDGEYDYTGGTKGDMVLPENGSGALLVNMTNTAPTFAGDLGDVHMNTIVTGIDLLDPAYAYDADGDPLQVIVNGQIATVSDFIEGNNVTAAELEYQGNDSWTYTPADGYTGGESFTVTLWDGEYDYTGGTKGDMVLPENGSGALLVNMTNTAPTFAGDLGDVHMNTIVTGIDLLDPAYAYDADGDPLQVIVNGQIATVSDFIEGNNVTAAELEYQGNDSWTYTPADGYTGGESFTVTLWDGEYDYTGGTKGDMVLPENGSGALLVNMTNTAPTFAGDLGDVHMNTIVTGIDLLDPAYAYDADGDPLQVIVNGQIATVSDFIEGNNVTAAELEYQGNDSWTYTPADGYTGGESFTVTLWDGEYDYTGGTKGDMVLPENGSGALLVNMTNTAPTFAGDLGDVHMNTIVTGIDLLDPAYAYDADGDPLQVIVNGQIATVSDFIEGNNVTAAELEYQGNDSWTYTPADGYTGGESFTVTLWDGEYDYTGGTKGDMVLPENGSGALLVNMTNILPSATGDLGSTPAGTPITVGQNDVVSPVLVIDFPDLPQQTTPDTLSIPDGIYQGSGGGSLVYVNGQWTYTPALGFSGTETFEIDVWDGENIYNGSTLAGPAYGQGTVSVTVTTTPPPPPTPTPTPDPVLVLAPVAPLADYEIPRLVGCPAEMEAAANELATNSDQLQLLIANAMATNPNLQPCDACASLLTAATVLKQMDNRHIAALAQIFNSQAPIDAPFTPEVSASVATAFANFREMETELAIMTDEQYEQYQQYALADELVEAFVSYVAVLENDLKLPVGDAMALVMDKYGEAVEAIDNPNISVYLIEQMEAVGVASELIIASAD